MDDTHYTGMVRRLSPDLWNRLKDVSVERQLDHREVMTRADDEVRFSALLLDGVVVRNINGGEERDCQFVAIQLPGDFVDLHGLPLKRLDHDVMSLGPARLALFEHEKLERIMASDIGYARQLWGLTMIDAAIHRHWAFRMGQLRALAGMANFLCELHLRMELCGRVEQDRFALPLTQAELAQACGMSVVHVNRVLRELREAGIFTFRDGVVHVRDRAAATRIGKFDPSYLFLPWEAPGEDARDGVAETDVPATR